MALFKVFANYSPVKVQQFDDEAEKVEETAEEPAEVSKTRASVGGAKSQPVQNAGKQSCISSDPADPMQVEKQFFKLLVLAQLLNIPETLMAHSNPSCPLDQLEPEEMF